MGKQAKWPRVSGGKCIEKWTLQTDVGDIECRSYMVRGDEETTWECRARIGEEFPVLRSHRARSEEGHETLDELEERFRAYIRERVSIDWQPHLYVEVSSSYLVDPEAQMRSRPMFPENETLRNSRTLNLSLEIRVARVELGTTGSGAKKHRGGFSGGGGAPRNGWPDVGKEERRRSYGSGGDKMLALIEDTPANREAVEAIRQGMQRLNERLQVALSPEHIEQAFANVHRLLPATGEH
jgi:hypothetical protein